ncbi:peptidase S24 [Sphingobacteriales bacterium UPWRP_1]|nr:peptidase S24 [Sphingobacteriales bacterium TSM_CSS]PSJ76630.1 peptidase S24 [Sphingobacteriales bacterium UPWRP_1]
MLQHLSTIGLLEFFGVEHTANVQIPLFGSCISAGFPSPADDYVELKIDLNHYLVKNPAATFYVRVKGNSMENAGIYEGDILVVDRALPPKDNDIAICVITGEFTVKRITKRKGRICLLAENTNYLPIEIAEDTDFQIWGIVSYIIHKAQ